MLLLRCVTGLALVTPACPAPGDPPVAGTPERAPTSDATALGPVASVEREATVHMASHFAELRVVHTSLIRGLLPEARAAAARIVAEQPKMMLESWAPYLYATQDAARQITLGGDLAATSRAAATLARSCGDCHRAQAAQLTRVATTAPPAGDDDDDDARMRRHAWAFDRLWEALVVPSDAAWNEGVAAFVELPACNPDLSGEQDREAIARARETVRTRQPDARTAQTLDARAEIYADLLPTCASCHGGAC